MKTANLGPASLMCTAVANGSFAAACLNIVPVNPIFASWILTAYFIQVFVIFSDIRRGNFFAANITLVFSSFMFLAGSLKIFVSYSTEVWGWQYNAAPAGIGTLIVGAILFLTIPVLMRIPRLTAFMFFSLALVFLLTGLQDLSILPFDSTRVIGILLVFASLLPLYEGSAVLVNEVCGKKIYPVPGPFISENRQESKSDKSSLFDILTDGKKKVLV